MRRLLIVDDDNALRRTLARSMESRNFDVTVAESVADAMMQIANTPPDYAILDLKLEDGHGLEVVEKLRSVRPECRIIILTGFGNIATAAAECTYYCDRIGFAGWLVKNALPDSHEAVGRAGIHSRLYRLS